MARIYDSILDVIGNTPIVRLNRIGRETGCELLAKCEYLNPGGSVKDRIGARMVLDLERQGRIRPGDVLIEPTSGNTGIGICLAAAVRGYRVIITMPEKMSHEKQVVMEALGAEIVRTPTEAAWDDPDSHISVARRLQEVVPRATIPDQYSNPSNPAAHYEGTGAEIVRDLEGRLDIAVLSAGTGGTITGVARRLKEEIPGVRIVGVDPVGSILAGPAPPEELKPYKVEGIGYDFVPEVLDRNLVDEWIKTQDRESFLMARRLIRQEGLLVGGSSGAAVWAAVQVASRPENRGKRILVLLPDSIRNYLTRFVDDKWMKDNHFLEAEWELQTVGELAGRLNLQKPVTAGVADTVREAVRLMKEHGISQVPVLDEGALVGIVDESDLLDALVAGRAGMESSLAEVMNRQVNTVAPDQPASVLHEFFDRGEVAILVEDGQVRAVIGRIDLISWLAGGEKHAGAMAGVAGS